MYENGKRSEDLFFGGGVRNRGAISLLAPGARNARYATVNDNRWRIEVDDYILGRNPTISSLISCYLTKRTQPYRIWFLTKDDVMMELNRIGFDKYKSRNWNPEVYNVLESNTWNIKNFIIYAGHIRLKVAPNMKDLTSTKYSISRLEVVIDKTENKKFRCLHFKKVLVSERKKRNGTESIFS